MNTRRFDDLSRTIGRGLSSRRNLVVRLVGLAGLTGINLPSPVQAKNDKDKDKKKGDGTKEKDAKCRGAGHPCEGNQICCEGLICAPSGPGAAHRCAAPATGACENCTTATAVTYVVQADCAYDAGAGETTCACSAAAPGDAPAVRALAISTAEVCAEVVGGDATVGSALGAAAGFASSGVQGTVTLVFAGRVEASGSATWWCTTDAGTVPASGPAFARVQEDVSDSTGAVDVRALACPVAGESAGYDWYGRCADPAAGARFSLTESGATRAATDVIAGPDGRLRFGGLSPGTYHLTQTSASWCHAESDGVDVQGNVVVQAGKRVTVWIFNCAGAK